MAKVTPEQRRQGALDLNAKLRLEAELRPRLLAMDRRTARSVARSLGTRGVLPDVRSEVTEALEPILLDHYAKVTDVFDHRTSDRLDDELEPSAEEVAAIAALMATFNEERAPVQAGIIGDTTERDARRSVEIAREVSTNQLLAGDPPPSPQEEAVVAGAILFRRLGGRRSGRILTETQAVAEHAKHVEAMILTGAEPSETQPIPVASVAIPEKVWVTRGDSIVREHHADADGQVQKVDQPFIVMEELLMFPGDVSMGASPENVINCRCSSVFDADAIRSVRSLI